MTADLRDLGVTPEHHDAQAALAVLADRVDAATLALLAGETPERRAALSIAVTAFHAGRVEMSAAAYEAEYGPGESL